MTPEYVFYQITSKLNNGCVVADGSIPLPERSHLAVLLVREMYDKGYMPIIRWSDGSNQEEYERLNRMAPLQVHSHITTNPSTGFCIPDSPSLTYHLYQRPAP